MEYRAYGYVKVFCDFTIESDSIESASEHMERVKSLPRRILSDVISNRTINQINFRSVRDFELVDFDSKEDVDSE